MKTVILTSDGFSDDVPESLAKFIGKEPDELGYSGKFNPLNLPTELIYRNINDVVLFKISANLYFKQFGFQIGDIDLNMKII